jgi:hypothetical protein
MAMRLAAELVAVVAGAVAMFIAIPRAARRKRTRRRPDQPVRPADLVRLERLVVTGRSTAGDVHQRLRPVLREVAAARLRPHGVWLDRAPEEARRLLGDELWELVRADRPRPPEPHAPGLSLEQLNSVVTRLERL